MSALRPQWVTKDGYMILIGCPLCGSRPSTEFVYLDEVEAPADLVTDDLREWRTTIYFRKNSNDESDEVWQHASGCRQVLVLSRNRSTNAVRAVSLARGSGAAAGPGVP